MQSVRAARAVFGRVELCGQLLRQRGRKCRANVRRVHKHSGERECHSQRHQQRIGLRLGLQYRILQKRQRYL